MKYLEHKVVLALVLCIAFCGFVSAGATAQEGVPELDLTSALIAAIVAAVASFVVEYVPGASGWWDECDYKELLIVGFGLVVTIVLVGAHYIGAVNFGFGPFGWPVATYAIMQFLTFAGAASVAHMAQKVGALVSREL